jgi:hypothetical protein
MTDAAPAIFIALEQSGFGSGIRQSIWLYPAANIGHIVSLVVFAGAVAVMDLRLLGAFHATAPGHVIARARIFALLGFLGLAVTGGMLFSAEASHLVINRVFQIKMGLVAFALFNIAIYHLVLRRRVEGLAAGAVIPGSARFVGGLSILVWIVVAGFGRSIAYF